MKDIDSGVNSRVAGYYWYRCLLFGLPDRVPTEIFETAAKTGFYISRTPVVMEGRVELLQYFLEQSICNNYHRYGNLGARTLI